MKLPRLRFFKSKRFLKVKEEKEILQEIEDRVKEYSPYSMFDMNMMTVEKYREVITKSLFEDNAMAKMGKPVMYVEKCAFSGVPDEDENLEKKIEIDECFVEWLK